MLRRSSQRLVVLFGLILLTIRRLKGWQTFIELRVWFVLAGVTSLIRGVGVGLVQRLVRGKPLQSSWSIGHEVKNSATRALSSCFSALVESDPRNCYFMRGVFEYLNILNTLQMKNEGYIFIDFLADGVPCRAIALQHLEERIRKVISSKEECQRDNDLTWVIHFHGGGYISGTLDASQNVARHYNFYAQERGIDLCVVIPAYSLAPEIVFPGAVEDAVKSYCWHAKRIVRKKLVVGGESAGGGLSAALIMALRDGVFGNDKVELPAAVLLMSPMLDCDHSADYSPDLAKLDIITPACARRAAKTYCPDPKVAKDHPLASPIVGGVHGFPPIFLSWGEAEIFRDNCVKFAEKASQQNHNIIQEESYPEMIHSFQLQWDTGCEKSAELYMKVMDFIVRFTD